MVNKIDNPIEQIAQAYNNGNGNTKICVLCGAGVSITAGIPSAGKIVSDIKSNIIEGRKYSASLTGLGENPSYQEVMRTLSINDRKTIFQSYIEGAKINWAHIALISMMEAEFIDRILTTNFDPLLIRTSYFLNVTPAIYDYGTNFQFSTNAISDPSLHYLHGQHNGYSQRHSNTQELPENNIEALLNDSAKNRIFLVIGYSGVNDQIAEVMAKIQFGDNLFWIAHDKEPAGLNKILDNETMRFSGGHDADQFLWDLSQKLGADHPLLDGKPFSFLLDQFNNIADFTLINQIQGQSNTSVNPLEKSKELIEADFTLINQIQGQSNTSVNPLVKSIELIKADFTLLNQIQGQSNTSINPLANSKELIEKAKQDYEAKAGETSDKPSQNLTLALMNKDYQTIIKYHQKNSKKDLDKSDKNLIAAAYFMSAYQDHAQATKQHGDEAKTLYRHAIEKFEQVLKLKPDYQDALHNLGGCLTGLARLETGDKAKELHEQAIDIYKQILKLTPENRQALYNWGTSLAGLAKLETEDKAKELYQQAIEKYHKAIELKPDYQDALHNLGGCLTDLARLETGDKAKELHEQAIDIYKQILNQTPDNHKALYNWGTSLAGLAQLETGDKAKTLYRQAIEKYHKAIELNPEYRDAINNLMVVQYLMKELPSGEEELNQQGKKRKKKRRGQGG